MTTPASSHQDEPDGWPMFLRDATNNRPDVGDGSAAAEPRLEWTYETGGDHWSSPVVADGTVYIGSYDHHLYAIDAATGDLQWRYRTGDRIDGSPAVSDGIVYVGSHDRNIYALDAETGAERWIYGTRGIVRSSPMVHGDTVYVGAHCNYEVCVSYYDVRWPRTGFLYALDKATGNLRWRLETSSEGVTTTPATDGERLYVTASTAVRALDPETGDPRWEYTLPRNRDFLASPVLADGTVYAAGNTNGDIVALDAATGQEQWTFPADAVITATPTVHDGRVYAGALNGGATLHALSADDGTEQWTFEPAAQGIGSSPAIANGVIYVGAHNLDERIENEAGLYAIDTSGTQQWWFEGQGDSNRGFGASPAIVDGSLYIGGVGNIVYSFDITGDASSV